MRTDLPAVLRSARPGDVIELPPGHYDGEFVVDQPVELRPLDGPGTVTLSSSTGNTLMLLADATVRDLTVVGKAWGAAAIEVTGRVAPRIRNCDISAPGHIAFRVRAGARPEVTECRIGQALHGLRVESAGGEFRRCEFADTGLASVVGAPGADVLIADCRFVRQGGYAVFAERKGAITLRHNDFEGGPVAAVKTLGRVEVVGGVVHGGVGSALEVEDGVLTATRVRVENVGAEGVLVTGGEGLFTSCRFTGTHGPAVWMMGGRARFDECEAIDSDRDGFLVVAGEADFFRCVAHNNAGQGFSLLHKASITECGSFGNGRPDEVGDPVVERSDGPAFRVGATGFHSIYEAIEAAEPGDVIEIDPGEYVEAVSLGKPVEVRPAGSPGSVRLSAGEPHVLALGGGVRLRDIVLSGSVWVAGEAVLERCEVAEGRVNTGAGSSLSLRDCDLRAAVTANGALTMIGCTVTGSRGLSVMDPQSVVDIRDSVFEDITDTGIYVGAGHVTISNVRMRRPRNGLRIYGSTVEATGLTISEPADTGITVYDGTARFTECTVTDAPAQGVLVCGGVTTFDRCRSIGSGVTGFEIASGTSTLTRCVAGDGRHLGFYVSKKADATLVDCEG
ncbi:right-handed parallel beta-helix repeat-containing protein [Lentzea sp. NPDC005914]|uniref:right-handed parallel beta-helix repeat-containing protein n=1 Tax=Lentzea sp. NPDC005914 TaxID=3154572 RepID=UPI003401E03D